MRERPPAGSCGRAAITGPGKGCTEGRGPIIHTFGAGYNGTTAAATHSSCVPPVMHSQNNSRREEKRPVTMGTPHLRGHSMVM